MPEGLCERSNDDSGGSLQQWRRALSEKLCRVDVESPDSGPAAFPANLSVVPFSSGTLARVISSPQLVKRTSASIARDKCSDIALVYLRSGKSNIRQFDREMIVSPNDCIVLDFGSPFEIWASGPSQTLTLTMPRTWVERHFHPEDITGRRLDGSSIWGSALSAYLRSLYMDFDNEAALSPFFMGEQALQLMELALGGEFPVGSTHQKRLLKRIRSLMREMYDDEELTPATIARTANLSKTYIHRLFAEADTTFCTELDTIRINRAAALLESRSQRHLTINEIGTQCGLPNAPHFARKFRAAKGVTPSQYRQLRMPGSYPSDEIPLRN